MSGCLSKAANYIPADIAARCEKHAKNSLNDIKEKHGILRALHQLSDERLNQLKSRYVKLNLECMRMCSGSDEENTKLQQEYEGRIRDDLQQELNLTLSMRDENVRCEELGDVLFYYICRGEEPKRNVQVIICNVHLLRGMNSWYDVLRHEKVFSQFYLRLGGTPAALEYLLDKQPQVLFNLSPRVLTGHLACNNLHRILMCTRNSQGQTYMFDLERFDDWKSFAQLYRNNSDDWIELLSIRDYEDRTALHVNPRHNLRVLCHLITLCNQDKVAKLLAMGDNNSKTVYDAASCDNILFWLRDQFELENNYPLCLKPRILTLYNTNNREKAKEEAESIHEVFKDLNSESQLEIMGTSVQTIEIIKKAAAYSDTSVFIVSVMSHGEIGSIIDCEDQSMPLSAIEKAMCSQELEGRPKILVVQCCQTGQDRNDYSQTTSNGRRYDPRPPVSEFAGNLYEVCNPDFLVAQSSRSGQPSIRNVFIPYIAQEIKGSRSSQSINANFVDLIRKAMRRMMNEKMEQTPIVKSTLRGKICLNDQAPNWV